MSQSTRYFNCQ